MVASAHSALIEELRALITRLDAGEAKFFDVIEVLRPSGKPGGDVTIEPHYWQDDQVTEALTDLSEALFRAMVRDPMHTITAVSFQLARLVAKGQITPENLRAIRKS